MREQVTQPVLHSSDTMGAGWRVRLAMTVVAAGLLAVAGVAGAQGVTWQPAFALGQVAPANDAPANVAPANVTAAAPAGAASQAAEPSLGLSSGGQAFALQPGSGPMRLDASIGLQVGTLGFGVTAAKLIIGHLGIRAAFNFFNFGVHNTTSDVSYSARLRFQNLPVLLDFFPWSRGAFHITGGVVFNQNRIIGTGQSDADGNITINHDSYTQAQIGTLTAAIRYPSTAGYAGIGFGTPSRNSLIEFIADFGVMISTPHVSLTATGAASNPQLQSDLQAQQASTQTDVNKYAKIFPVVSSGIAIRL
jgi:hypothetical protein